MTAPSATQPRRRSIAVMVATASVTLAVGVTVAALTGYLGARPSVEEPSAQELVAEVAPAVVLVPVTQPRTVVSAQAEPEPTLAMSEPRRSHDDDDDDDSDDDDDDDDDDDRRHRKHHDDD